MRKLKLKTFTAKIYKIGVNPYVLLPAAVLQEIFKQADKDKGPIAVTGTLNGHPFIQTLVKYSGKWRLYLNTPMRKAAGIDTGDWATVEITYDPVERTIPIHPKLEKALQENKAANKIFESLRPSLQKEIVRYIHHLKTVETIDKNVQKAIQFLLGRERFIGRDKP